MSCIKEITFKRGMTFSYLFSMPENIPLGYFTYWEPKAKIRKKGNNQSNGVIAHIAAIWLDVAKAKEIHLFHNLTDNWPVGKAELDIFFQSPSGEKIASETLIINIVDNIT